MSSSDRSNLRLLPAVERVLTSRQVAAHFSAVPRALTAAGALVVILGARLAGLAQHLREVDHQRLALSWYSVSTDGIVGLGLN